MIFQIEDDIIKDLKVIGGCPGNLLGISNLVKGENINTVISKLEGVRCGFKQTSCPDQISITVITGRTPPASSSK